MRAPSETRALVLALAAHAVLLGALVVMPAKRFATPPVAPLEESVSIDVAEEPAQRAEAPVVDDTKVERGTRAQGDAKIERAPLAAAATSKTIEELVAPPRSCPRRTS